jgi:hypothetical protein
LSQKKAEDAARRASLRDRMESCDCTRAMVARWRHRDLDTTQPHSILIRVRWMARRAKSSFATPEESLSPEAREALLTAFRGWSRL